MYSIRNCWEGKRYLRSKPSTILNWVSRASGHCEKVNEVILKDVETSKVEMDELWTYDDEGTWIWISMAAESRLVLSHVVGEHSQESADRLVSRTARCLKALPLFVTDGLKFYKTASLNRYGKLQSFARTGKRGRPRLTRLIPDELF